MWASGASTDVRYAVRVARKRSALSLAIVLTLALGIGLDAAAFGVVAAGLSAAALITMYLPARRASFAEPIHVLRDE